MSLRDGMLGGEEGMKTLYRQYPKLQEVLPYSSLRQMWDCTTEISRGIIDSPQSKGTWYLLDNKGANLGRIGSPWPWSKLRGESIRQAIERLDKGMVQTKHILAVYSGSAAFYTFPKDKAHLGL